MFHSAGTGMDDQPPSPGGVVGTPVVGMKSQVPLSEATTAPAGAWVCGAVAARATRGSAASATAAALVVRMLRRVKAALCCSDSDGTGWLMSVLLDHPSTGVP